jgi:hypothetical protein
VYLVRAILILLQVVDQGYVFDGGEIGRPSYEPFMASIAREILQVLGFAHPLDHEHTPRTLNELRPVLASTAYFREYSVSVKLFQGRMRPNSTVLASQKSATIALNHVIARLGLRLKSIVNVRREALSSGSAKRRTLQQTYLGWYIERRHQSRTLPVMGPPGLDLMGQLLKMQVHGSPELKPRISNDLRAYLDGVEFKWPELVNLDDTCMIHLH